MKKIFQLFSFFLALCLGVMLFAQDAQNVSSSAKYTPEALKARLDTAVVQAEIPLRVPTPALKLIARSVVGTCVKLHYSQATITPSLCSEWFKGYFQMLDPQKIYFLQSDLEEFGKYEELIYFKGQPNLDFAFLVYQRFLVRMREWCVYTFQALNEPCDFTLDESMPIYDWPDDHDWPATSAEREDIWRKRVKNTLLSDQMTQENIAKQKSQESSDGTDVSHQAVYTPPPVRQRTQNATINAFENRLKVEDIEVVSYFLNAFCSLLDPHSNYLPPAAKEDFDIGMSLSLQGIGATLTSRDSYTVVLSLVPGGPAARDGHLKPGDKILAVAQSESEEPLDVVDMPLNKVVKRIRGAKGTNVFLTILPEGSSTTYVLKLTRDEIKLKDAEAQSSIYEVDGKRILCIYLPSFYRDFEAFGQNANAKSTTTDVLRLLAEAKKEGPVDGLIFDMRDNGGGSLEETISLSSAFLRSQDKQHLNTIVQTRNSRGDVQVRNATMLEPLFEGPLLVMVDRGAASATEIFSACMQDTERAVIVGDPGTHGKGSVQSVADLSSVFEIRKNARLLGAQEPGSVKVTIQKFYRNTGGATQIKGVTPDICFPSFHMASKTSEGDLPHVLPWDEIQPAYHTSQTNLKEYLPVLKDFYGEYAQNTPAFVRYTKEVEEYLKMRDKRSLPLEINARRAYQEEETAAVRRMRHFTPDRTPDDAEHERLHDADEKLYDDGAPREDVIFDASLAIMGQMLRIDDETGKKAFSISK